jgi:hypothetical protein
MRLWYVQSVNEQHSNCALANNYDSDTCASVCVAGRIHGYDEHRATFQYIVTPNRHTFGNDNFHSNTAESFCYSVCYRYTDASNCYIKLI